MADPNMVSQRDRAVTGVSDCQAQLRRAQADARRGGELLRRAVRDVEEAEVALAEATRRLDRMEVSLKASTRRTVTLDFHRNGRRQAFGLDDEIAAEG